MQRAPLALKHQILVLVDLDGAFGSEGSAMAAG
jgi:hypothetical protein